MLEKMVLLVYPQTYHNGICHILGRVNSGPQRVFLVMGVAEEVPGSTGLASLIHRNNCSLQSCP